VTSTINLPSGAVTGLPTTVTGATGQANYTPATATSPASATALNTYNGTNTSGSASNTSDTTSNGINSLLSLTNTGSTTTSRLASAVFSASDFNVIVSALKTQSNTKIVSNPTVVTLNNTEATLNIAEEFPLPNYTYNEQQGKFDVSGFTYKSIGINLKVTPQVNARGIIRLNVEPEVSSRTGLSNFGGASIPIIGTRKAKTQVSLKDGYTMGIGGLITATTSHGGTSVPVLGSIPVLGRLFSSKSVNDSTSNLLIFITARTVSADGASPELVFDPRAIQATGMTREDLPGNRATKGTDVFAPTAVAPASSR
jgi:type IV pilus assembly protein PilQ